MPEVNELSIVDRFLWEKLTADVILSGSSGLVSSGNEVQLVTKGSHTSGTFTLTFGADTTAAIAAGATAAVVQSSLEALPSIGAGNVLVTGADGGPWTVTFVGTLANKNVQQLIMTSSLTGGSGQQVSTTNDGGPRIYAEIAPQGVKLPYVIYAMRSSPDKVSFGAQARTFTRPIYLVKGVTTGESLVIAGQIADRIEAVLNGATQQFASPALLVMGTYRTTPFRLVEVFEGVRHNHVGGLYRMFVSKV